MTSMHCSRRENRQNGKPSTADEVNFIDPNKVAYFISQERVILQRDPVPSTDI